MNRVIMYFTFTMPPAAVSTNLPTNLSDKIKIFCQLENKYHNLCFLTQDICTFFTVHVWQVTTQHHWKRQWHEVSTSTTVLFGTSPHLLHIPAQVLASPRPSPPAASARQVRLATESQ